LQIIDTLVTVFQECFNVVANVLKVLFFLFLFLTLINSFGLVDILHNRFFLFIGSVPVLYSLHSLDRIELLVIDICVMGNSDEGLVNVGLRKKDAFSIGN
jgi:hypothetical protein